MKTQVKWGILGTATIAMEQVIPAMQNSQFCEVVAIASRSYEKAKNTAEKFHIAKAYGTYEELIADEEIEAVYIPLPNHLHVPWAINALDAGKHVLVEKPIGLSSAEAEKLVAAAKKHPDLKIMEAFMYRFHPQWVRVKELVDSGAIGEIKAIQASFSFFDDDPTSIVNNKEYGGGCLMDIGCYPISISRFLFGGMPKSVSAKIEYHPEFGMDTMAACVLEFEQGMTTFFSSIRAKDDQTVQIWGTKGSIRFRRPFNPANDKKAKIHLVRKNKKEKIKFDKCDQYTLQADAFARAILEDTEVPTSLSDAVENMKVIEMIIESDRLGKRIVM
ncbi:MAG: Gfo/Idh/MocA family oxidoreductase [Deferribacteres bacterium]|nr:Gfo/Idh/MocA family oxidoreductase [candidate division KSB1 bacterium]MCB9503951.1 Gfo/Idh/MocA family oxidoreductase [Deferribacteres bacterium]